MAFHYQPEADSSDDDVPVDLTAWQTAVKPKTSLLAPAATTSPAASGGSAPHHDQRTLDLTTAHTSSTSDSEASAVENEDVGLAEDNVEDDAFLSDLLRRSGDGDEELSIHDSSASILEIARQARDAMLSTSFTSINKPAILSISDDEEEQDTLVQRAEPDRILAPVIPRLSRDGLDDDVLDFTTGREVVRKVKKELVCRHRGMLYVVEFEDRHVEEITYEDLVQFEQGLTALDAFESRRTRDSSAEPQRRNRMSSTRPERRTRQQAGFVSTVDAVPVSDEEVVSQEESRARGRKRKELHSQYPGESDSDADEGSTDEEEHPRRRLRLRNGQSSGRTLRGDKRVIYAKDLEDDDDDDPDSEDAPFLDSYVVGTRSRRTKLKLRGPKAPDMFKDGIGYENGRRARVGERQSGRTTRHQGGMQEVGENQIYRSDSDDAARAPVKQKVVGAREQFKTLPRNDEFRMRHIQQCDTCGHDANFAPLIYCQGCTLSYHKSCLGVRSTREHLATKVTDEFSVLQCRRCIAVARKKDPTAPDQGKCADCHEHGASCAPFRLRKTPAQEQKEREDNDGQDPTYAVHESRINQASNVLFRCMFCWRAFHFEHLPSRSDVMDMDTDIDSDQRFREYSRDWKCKECLDMPAKVSGLIAWKPVDEDNYDPGVALENIDEDEKAYLVKWDEMSYFRACWMPGAWVWGSTAASMRKAFAKRDNSQHPKMRTEDAIPEDYLRADIVLDIKFTSIVDIRTEEIDKARIREVDKALIKYKGLGYEDAVWEAPPSPEDGDRWADFVMAYTDWVLGRYVRPPKPATIKSRIEKARSQDFAKLEKTKQPDNVEGGELMKYQIEGLNWLYYKWFTQKNAILADEMGLGKTIQIIGFLATLVADWSCFPFLVVVPNSTCPNWRREVKRWAPSLRVVAYYGSKESRDLAYRYELFPEGSKDLRCHIVVTSYDAAADDSCRKFFRSVQWQGLIVDEGQRLKNDKNLLYSALGALKCPFKILLTGTPLQNNQRELFNLLHFLDDSYDSAQLEQDYADLDSDKIVQLHDMIRPFFLRRTKAQVLTFLPPMAQIIIPVSMTVVQKKLYRTILAKNPELMKAIFSSETPLKQSERASLSNVLMQLRKCLCHPFVYNASIEDRGLPYSASHRNLVDASSKLRLLEVLLPRLKERGHRVLIFSQFLDMLNMVEDFLDDLRLQYQRLDGTINALQKQKRIDEFNAPDSPLFAFLLSTRAGGVGINLASADTVIILDPDFNPHQDIQALSRAHRIGQHKKVLCFQLVTRASAEERIMQMGRRKLALDHVLIQEMDADDAEQNDLVSVLRYGATELFEDSGDKDITYDGSSVDRLLDRSHMEDTRAGEDKSAETQFSFARVWANDQGTLREEVMTATEEQQVPDPGVWANILKERERAAAADATSKADAYGRGRRARVNVDYSNDRAPEGVDALDIIPAKGRKIKNGDESDTDFQAEGSEGDDEPPEGEAGVDADDLDVVEGEVAKRDIGRTNPVKAEAPRFRRAIVPPAKYAQSGTPTAPAQNGGNGPVHSEDLVYISDGINCVACRSYHPPGKCPLKLAGVEYCNLCGIAHYGSARVCPHIQSETQVRLMLEALKHSNEPEHLIIEARRYLRGLKGNLVHMKKQAEAKKHAAREAQNALAYQQATAPIWRV